MCISSIRTGEYFFLERKAKNDTEAFIDGNNALRVVFFFFSSYRFPSTFWWSFPRRFKFIRSGFCPAEIQRQVTVIHIFFKVGLSYSRNHQRSMQLKIKLENCFLFKAHQWTIICFLFQFYCSCWIYFLLLISSSPEDFIWLLFFLLNIWLLGGRPVAPLVEQAVSFCILAAAGSIPPVALCCMSFPLSPLFPVYSSAVLSKK